MVMVKYHVLPVGFAIMLVVFSSIVMAQETLVNEAPPEIIEPVGWWDSFTNWVEDVWTGKTIEERTVEEWTTELVSTIENQDYIEITTPTLVTIQKTHDEYYDEEQPVYSWNDKCKEIQDYYWDGTKNITNGTHYEGCQEYIGNDIITKTRTIVDDEFQQVMTRYDTWIIPKDTYCYEDENEITCLSITHCVAFQPNQYIKDNIRKYKKQGCSYRIIPKEITSSEIIIDDHTSKYYSIEKPKTAKQILQEKDEQKMMYVLPDEAINTYINEVTI